jgi:hypothetical protein
LLCYDAAIAFQTAFLDTPLNEINYQVVQAIAGRTRIRIPWLKTNEEAAGKLQRLVESLNYVTSVRINPQAQSIIVFYRASALSPKALEAQIASAIQQSNPASPGVAPPAPTTAVESAPTVSPSPSSASPVPATTASSEVGAFPSAPSPAVSESVAKPAADSVSASPSCVELPSPWDEPPEPEPEVPPAPEPVVEAAVAAPVEQPQAVPETMPEPEVPEPVPTEARSAIASTEEPVLPAHSTASLAKRLNTTSQAITHRRNRPDFPTWTQSQDPERIAWKYDAASQSFGPAEAAESAVLDAPTAIAPQPEAAVTAAVEASQPVAEAELPPEPTKKQTTPRKSKSKKPASRRSSSKR